MLKFTNIQVARVANGWIVLSDGVRHTGGSPDDAIVVKEGEDLGGAIAAALVAGKLSAASNDQTQGRPGPDSFRQPPAAVTGSLLYRNALDDALDSAAFATMRMGFEKAEYERNIVLQELANIQVATDPTKIRGNL